MDSQLEIIAFIMVTLMIKYATYIQEYILVQIIQLAQKTILLSLFQYLLMLLTLWMKFRSKLMLIKAIFLIFSTTINAVHVILLCLSAASQAMEIQISMLHKEIVCLLYKTMTSKVKLFIQKSFQLSLTHLLLNL